MTRTDIAVAGYGMHTQAVDAVRNPARAGFGTKRIAIAGADHRVEKRVVGDCGAGDRARFFGMRDRVCGVLTAAGDDDVQAQATAA